MPLQNMVENRRDSHKIGEHGTVQVKIEKIEMQIAKAFRSCLPGHLKEPCRGKDMLCHTEFLSSEVLTRFFALPHKSKSIVKQKESGIVRSIFEVKEVMIQTSNRHYPEIPSGKRNHTSHDRFILLG